MYEMKPEYYIGIDMIDEEHKQLFQYADEAYELLHNDMIPDKFDTIHDVLMNLRKMTIALSTYWILLSSICSCPHWQIDCKTGIKD